MLNMQMGLMILLGAAGVARSISTVVTEAPNACSASAFLNNTDFHDGQGLVMDIYTSASTARFLVSKIDPNCPLRHSNPGMCHDTSRSFQAGFYVIHRLGNAPGKDGMDCCAQCSSPAWADKGCKFFTLSMGTCWFKKDDSGRRYIAGAVSGGISGAPLGPPPPPPPKATCPDPNKINIASSIFSFYNFAGRTWHRDCQR
jgi:hypothetical protein